MPGKRQIIQVVPRMTPMVCGVSDDALLLARELEAGFGIASAVAVLNAEQTNEIDLPIRYGTAEQLFEMCLELSNGEPGFLLVHVSGYGYSADGAPTLLAEALEGVKADGRFRIAAFFHELFATGMPWRSAFWYSRRQKSAVRRIAETCDLAMTNTREYEDWLAKETVLAWAGSMQSLPVFSHVGETAEPAPLAEREPVMAVFGLGGTRANAFRELTKLGHLLEQLGVREIVDIGPEFAAPGEAGGVEVRRMGVLAAVDIGREFSRTAFGFLSYPRMPLAKSGVLAGYCAHGVIPVIAQPFAGQSDGLQDGVHVLSPGTADAAQAQGWEACSRAAWQWYAGHRLHDHAAVYAHWMEAMGAAPQSAGGNHG